MKKILLSLIFLSVGSVTANDTQDLIIEALKNSDPEALRQLLMPGFYIHSDQKKKYYAYAQEVTNRSYADLSSHSASDVPSIVFGTAKLAIAALFGYLGYRYYYGRMDVSSFGEAPNYIPESNRYFSMDTPADRPYRTGVLVALASLAAYFGYNGLEEFSSVLSKYPRLVRHHDALAVEAIISRIPSCDTGSCLPTPSAIIHGDAQ